MLYHLFFKNYLHKYTQCELFVRYQIDLREFAYLQNL